MYGRMQPTLPAYIWSPVLSCFHMTYIHAQFLQVFHILVLCYPLWSIWAAWRYRFARYNYHSGSRMHIYTFKILTYFYILIVLMFSSFIFSVSRFHFTSQLTIVDVSLLLPVEDVLWSIIWYLFPDYDPMWIETCRNSQSEDEHRAFFGCVVWTERTT
jgi:hypothetical protein